MGPEVEGATLHKGRDHPPSPIPWPAGSSAEAVAPGAAGVWGWEDEYASSPVSLVRLKEGHQVREKVKDSRGKFLKESF